MKRHTQILLFFILLGSLVANVFLFRKSPKAQAPAKPTEQTSARSDTADCPSDPASTKRTVEICPCSLADTPSPSEAPSNPSMPAPPNCKEVELAWETKRILELQRHCEEDQDENSCANLGLEYLKGVEGVLPADTEKGLALLETYCKDYCASIVGELYDEGNGALPKNATKAIEWHQKACQDQNSPIDSCARLAKIYGQASGEFYNPKLAEQYERKACSREHTYYNSNDACAQLAKKYIEAEVRKGLVLPPKEEGDLP